MLFSIRYLDAAVVGKKRSLIKENIIIKLQMTSSYVKCNHFSLLHCNSKQTPFVLRMFLSSPPSASLTQTHTDACGHIKTAVVTHIHTLRYHTDKAAGTERGDFMCLRFDKLSLAPKLNRTAIIADLFAKIKTAVVAKGRAEEM